MKNDKILIENRLSMMNGRGMYFDTQTNELFEGLFI